MAEFVEVCKQMLRRAEAIAQRKGGGRTYVEFCVSKDGGIVGGTSTATAEEIERTVMEWATEHPEPKYPTWEEWQKANFPTVHDVLHPCSFMKREEVELSMGIECGKHSCNDCARRPIPADIAEKLGVKAIERNENK